LRYAAEKEELPAVLLEPKGRNIEEVAIWVDGRGKQAMFDPSGEPVERVRRMLERGTAVLGLDVLGQGEFTPDGQPLAKARVLNQKARSDKKYADQEDRWDPKDGWGRYLGYTLGYNRPLFSQRVHDILSAVSYVKHSRPAGVRVAVLGQGGAGPWVAAARAQAGGLVDRAVIDSGGFRFAKITALDDPNLLPGGAKYLDLPGILVLSAPHKLVLLGEGDKAPPVVAAAYQAASHPENLSLSSGKTP
jgi:hypothetical protein